ncbi:COG2426 family protein [Butyrivibrio proteoclasticus]|uniref:COG2426 family protein n=1 Tax=Butyrivibrio proteoclasticus TaxID=43305 RepID=UPI0005540A78|nr:small multi-drug export protein [Butyrivibrio proteoclasticus]
MAEFIRFFTGTLVGQYITVFVVSMVPLIELRGAIPFAYGFVNTTDTGFNLLLGYILIAVGNMIPVPLIYFFARKILEWGKDRPVIGKFFRFCLEKGEKGGKKLQEKAGRGLFVALLLFVGIPLPGTGAWTGTLAASILDMDFKKTVGAVICGIALAAIIVSVVCALGFGAWLGITA